MGGGVRRDADDHRLRGCGRGVVPVRRDDAGRGLRGATTRRVGELSCRLGGLIGVILLLELGLGASVHGLVPRTDQLPRATRAADTAIPSEDTQNTAALGSADLHRLRLPVPERRA